MIVAAIAERLEGQHPGNGPLTLSGMLTDVRRHGTPSAHVPGFRE